MRKAMIGVSALVTVALSLDLPPERRAKTTVDVRNALVGAQLGGGETSMTSGVRDEETRSSPSSRALSHHNRRRLMGS